MFIQPQDAIEVVVQYLADQGFDLKPRHVIVFSDSSSVFAIRLLHVDYETETPALNGG